MVINLPLPYKVCARRPGWRGHNKKLFAKKMKLFPKGKSCYCFTPPTWLPRTYSIPGVKRNDCQKKHRLVEITQVYRQLIRRNLPSLTRFRLALDDIN